MRFQCVKLTKHVGTTSTIDLLAMGIELEKPDGAFYLFPSIAKFGLSSQEFAMRLLHEEHVAVVPGDAFTSYGEGYIRISYAYAQDVLDNRWIDYSGL